VHGTFHAARKCLAALIGRAQQPLAVRSASSMKLCLLRICRVVLLLEHAVDCITQLGGTLTLLGEFEPIARQLFVAPFAFFVPAIAGAEEIHGHGDLHH
jgi:hypothetical protein